MRVTLIDLNMPHYSVALANALADKVDLTFIQAEQVAAPWKSLINTRMRYIIRERPKKRSPFSIIRFSQWIDVINDLKPDILHVQNSANPWFDLIGSLRRLPPTVVTIHNAVPHPGHSYDDRLSGIFRSVFLRQSRGVIVHASSERDLLCSKERIPTDRAHVIPHGELGTLYRAIANRPTDTPANPYTVLFFGGIVHYKGLGILIRAMEAVHKDIPQAKLIIAGKGDPISRYLPSRICPDWIEIIERYIPEPDISALFGRAGMVVLPYLEASQSGVAALALGLGTPVIASSVGGLKEIIRDGVDGILVPPKDTVALANAIAGLMSNESRRCRLSEAASVRCQSDLSWDQIATRTVQLYRQILKTA